MKIRLSELPVLLTKKNFHLFILQGEDVALMHEAHEHIKLFTKKAGVTHSVQHEVTAHFNIQAFEEELKQISLFQEKTLYILQIQTQKNSKEFQTTLVKIANQLRSDQYLILVFKKLEAAQQKTKWFSEIEKNALFIPLWPLSESQQMQLLKEKFNRNHLSISPQALRFIIEYYENNLLAMHQLVERLTLIHLGQQQIDENHLANELFNQSLYNLFDLADSLLQGDLKKCLIIFNHLKSEGTEAILILWLVSKEIRLLIKLKNALEQGTYSDLLLTQNGIWTSKKNIYLNAVKNISLHEIIDLIPALAKLDTQIKSENSVTIWDQLLDLILKLCHLISNKIKTV